MDWLKYRRIYFAVSGFLIAVGAFGLVSWGVKLGVDFTGGTIIEYRFEDTISTEEVAGRLQEEGFESVVIQEAGENRYLFRLPPINQKEKSKLVSTIQNIVEGGGFEEIKFETVGPTIGSELVKKTVYAILVAAASILVWVAFQFKSFKFGVSAILAMFHDSFILIGSFSLLGHFFGAEVDFLFVTALLTTLSFSVHDTIVVYDRIREKQDKVGGKLYELANSALTETMVRSLNNSFTIMFMLVALILLGGSTIKWFAIALFIGTVLGTYSSPFVAAPLLITWDKLESKIKN